MINYNMDNLIFNINKLLPSVGQSTDERLVITITDNGHNHKGILYFERVKAGFNRKPISMNSWACVDARTEGLYDMGGEYTSLDILNHCQKIIREFVL